MFVSSKAKNIFLVLFTILFTACGGQPTEDLDPVESVSGTGIISVMGGMNHLLNSTDSYSVSDKTITLKNTGDGKVTSISISSISSPFRFKGGVYPGTTATCSDNLTSQNSCTLLLEFAPTSIGTHSGNLLISYNNGVKTNTLNINLSGEATDPGQPVILGLSDSFLPTKSQTWSWSCSTNCEYRYLINTSSSYSFSGESYSNNTSTTHSSGNGTYYLHIQARDTSTLVESEVLSVETLMDNTSPSDPTISNLAIDASLTSSSTLSWLASSDENSISHYEFAIGTSVGAEDILNFKNIANVLSFQESSLNLITRTDYYISIRAVDEAGNSSNIVTSASWQVPTAPIIFGLSDDNIPTKIKSWNWSCEGSCQYRYTINNSSSHSFSSEAYGADTSTNQSSGNGNYYLHIQAKDIVFNLESEVVSVLAVLDNMSPTDPVISSQDIDATENSSATSYWSQSTDETEFSHYELAIGTSMGATDVSSWQNVGNVLSSKYSNAMGLNEGIDYWTSVRAVDRAGNYSAVSSFIDPWRIPGKPETINSLASSGALTDQISIGWSAPYHNGSVIIDYIIEYKASLDSEWILFADGISTDTTEVITGLSPSTSYDFRVRAYNGSTSSYSNILVVETAPDNEFFEPNFYQAMNLGGATASEVVAFEDNTEIFLNNTSLVILNAGETFGFSSALNDVMKSEKAFFVAGLYNPSGNSSDSMKGNMVWSTPNWAGKKFIFTGTRDKPHKINVFAFENGIVNIKQGASVIASHEFTDISVSATHSFSLTQDGGFVMESEGLIIAHMHSSASNRVTDPKPLLPASTDILGIPSTTGKFSTSVDATNFIAYHSNDVVSGSVQINSGTAYSITGQGTNSLYSAAALRIISDQLMVGNSNADSNGYCSAPFVPTSMLKKRYAINVDAEYIAFASLEGGTINITNPDGSSTTVELLKTGDNPYTPYKARLTKSSAGTTLAKGTRFESNVRFQSWYEPRTNVNAADNDETVMFGFD